MVTKEEFENALAIIKEYRKQVAEEHWRVSKLTEHIVRNDDDIMGFDLSIRALNVLRANNITTIGDLLKIHPDSVRNFRRCGSMTAQEIKVFIQKLIVE